MATTTKDKDKQKVLKAGKAVHAEALAALHAAASMLGHYLSGNDKISKSRKNTIKFIKNNRGKTAKIKAAVKKHQTLANQVQRDYDAKKAKANATCAAAAKKVNAFVKKNKALLTSAPKFKQIADKLEEASDLLAKVVPKKK